jgi:predicted RNA binding protein YcfA (HicA-like mRNA interferase family)
MTRLPVLRAREVVAALEKAGFQVHHQTGSHARLRRVSHPVVSVTVPIHGGDVPRATLRRILVQAGLTVEEFLRLLRS